MKKIIYSVLLLVGGIFSIKAADVPVFPGGEKALKKYLAENTKYPEMAKENGVEGIVSVGFIVNTDGSLSQIKVIKLIDPDLEEEAIRIVTGMPKWIPAEKDGTPVEAPSKVEVPFILDE